MEKPVLIERRRLYRFAIGQIMLDSRKAMASGLFARTLPSCRQRPGNSFG